MSRPERQQNVLELLKGLQGIEPLKQLFWSELNYQRVNQLLSRRGWTESASKALADDPVLFAGGGEDEAFHVIYCRLTSQNLSRGLERPVVTQLLREHPYALFIFSNKGQTDWHFLNVKFDDQAERRQLYRRITVRPGAGLRTATERVQLLDLAEIHPELFGITPLAIQQRCDAAFDVETVTKDFFTEVANWYFWALKNAKFPKDAPKEADGHDHISIIRLITRLIFCWFVKEKGLIPDTLFDERKLAQTLAGFAPEKTTDKESVFYKAILQNLFFATLNTEMDKRAWRKDDNNFMAHILYRHRALFQKPNEALDFFKNIPFLNGGLFECLDKREGTAESPKDIRIDGFSDRSDSQPTVPDFLFFGAEREVDLSEDYGDKKFKSVPVRGLIHIFNRYNFTVEEDTPIDQEVALDPELSGKVFENLLAAYNPETGATARKQTGSFYTPREIVNYMVDESLIACLQSKLVAAEVTRLTSSESKTGVQKEKLEPPHVGCYEVKLRQLFAYTDEPHQFTAPEVDALIAIIDSLKTLDPAVGSGAFPMGILHKLVFILGKLDPHNEKWKERQIQRVRNTIKEAEKTEDAARRDKMVNDLEEQITGINEAFRLNELDYGRKLYLIENRIYGVDIQHIAVQIAKMRFFISLIVDQKIDDAQPNRGVRPLPNLETKFVAANTLIGVERRERQGDLLTEDTVAHQKLKDLRQQLTDVRHRYFQAKTPASKTKCRYQDRELREKMSALLQSAGLSAVQSRQFAGWNPYDQNASAEFFDAEWMFGINEGFCIVIGNPPYLKERDNKNVFDVITSTAWGSRCHEGKMDYWFFFLHRALELSGICGIVSFITSRYWLNSAGAKKLVAHIRKSAAMFHIVDIGDLRVFEQVAGHHMLHFYRVAEKQSVCLVKQLHTSLEDVACWANTDCLHISNQTAAKLFSDNGELKLYEASLELPKVVTVGDCFEVTQGVVQNPDKVSGVMARRYGLERGLSVFVLEEMEIQGLKLTKAESGFVRPFYDEAAIGRFDLDRSASKSLLYLTKKNCPVIKGLPNIEKHLRQFKLIMDARRETVNGTIAWFQLHWPRDPRFFESPKVVLPSMFSLPCAAYVSEAAYFGLGSNVVVGGSKPYSLKLLCAFLNSKVGTWWFYTHGKQRGVGVDIGVDRLRQFPLPKIVSHVNEVETLVDQILAKKLKNHVADTTALEREIDQLVYALYGLTQKQTKAIEEEIQ